MSGSTEGVKRRRGGKILLNSKIVIFTGSFGSGKTEIAINQSINALKRNENVVLADLDIVNPYFRSRDVKEKLERIGIEVIAPEGKMIFADLPVISPEVKGKIEGNNYSLFIDLGGDEIGAKSISSFYPILENIEYEMTMVINPYRPFTKDIEEIYKLFHEIELSSRLKIKSLISNPHLEDQTDLNLIAKGHNIVKEFSELLKIPIIFLTIEESIYKKIGKPSFKENVLTITRFMSLPWDEPENELINPVFIK